MTSTTPGELVVPAGMAPLRVTAHLAAGVVQSAPWGIALDGLVGSQRWQQIKAAGETVRAREVDNPPDLDLPLARCGQGPAWHWAATCAFPDGPTSTDIRTWTGRLDPRDLETVADRVPATSTRQGRYRTRRMPMLATVCPRLTWHAVGNIELIAALLDELTWIGKKRRSGEGEVLRWDVTAEPDLDPFHAAHLHPDGTLGRPTPPGCWEHLPAGTRDGGHGPIGIRPPSMHPSRVLHAHFPAPWPQS